MEKEKENGNPVFWTPLKLFMVFMVCLVIIGGLVFLFMKKTKYDCIDGKCTISSNGKYETSDCDKNCNDNCGGKQCKNGNCSSGICICNSNYEGENCDVDKCANKVCNNGGSCEDGTCTCKNNYTGENCDITPQKPSVFTPRTFVPSLNCLDKGIQLAVDYWGPSGGGGNCGWQKPIPVPCPAGSTYMKHAKYTDDTTNIDGIVANSNRTSYSNVCVEPCPSGSVPSSKNGSTNESDLLFCKS